jgi:hypothetical protein
MRNGIQRIADGNVLAEPYFNTFYTIELVGRMEKQFFLHRGFQKNADQLR